MDYNAHQGSLAPCQIDIMQANLNSCLQSRFVYKCTNCLPATATFDIAPIETCMPAVIWLESRAACNYQWSKLEIDQLDKYGRTVPGTHSESTLANQVLGRVRLDNTYSFFAGSTYQVKWTTEGNCGSAAVRVRSFTTPPCVVALPQARTAAAPNLIPLPPSTSSRH